MQLFNEQKGGQTIKGKNSATAMSVPLLGAKRPCHWYSGLFGEVFSLKNRVVQA